MNWLKKLFGKKPQYNAKPLEEVVNAWIRNSTNNK